MSKDGAAYRLAFRSGNSNEEWSSEQFRFDDNFEGGCRGSVTSGV